MATFATKDVNLVPVSLDAEPVGSSSSIALSHVVKVTKNGGTTPYKNLDIGVTGVIVDSNPTALYGGLLFNGHATALRYLKVYDLSTQPTDSDTPVFTIPLKAQEITQIPAEAVGIKFVNGVGLRASTGIADNDTGAPSTNDVVVNLFMASLGPQVLATVGSAPAAGPVPVVTG